MINSVYIQKMCWEPVLDPTDPTKLNSRIEKICVRLRRDGFDPLKEMNRCATRLRAAITELHQTHHPKSRILTNDDPKWTGSLAWYNYMLDRVGQIVTVLVNRRLMAMLSADIRSLS